MSQETREPARVRPPMILSTWQKAAEHLQFRSLAQSCLTLCNPMNSSTPGLPVHHKLPEFTQTHVHQVGDAIQPSHPLSSPFPPAPNPSQHQGLFQWVNSSHEVAKVLEFQLQHQSFQCTPRTELNLPQISKPLTGKSSRAVPATVSSWYPINGPPGLQSPVLRLRNHLWS